MSLTITPIVCCCTATPTPAEVCPTSDPCPTRTVRISVAADPIACDPADIIDCRSCADFDIATCTCDDDAWPLSVPETTWTTGLSQAVAAIGWSSYVWVENGPPCTVTTYECGHDTIPFTEQYVNVFELTLGCSEDGGFGGCGESTVAYYPSEAAWTAYAGVKVAVSGCCCGACDCNTPYLCSRIDIVISARWTLDITGRAIVEIGVDCEPNRTILRGSGVDASYSQQITHEQTASLRYEKVIYDTQTDCGLAPGAYTLAWASLHNDPGAVVYNGYGWNHVGSTCQFYNSDFLYHTSPPPDCDTTDTCSRGELKIRGWSIGVSVDP